MCQLVSPLQARSERKAVHIDVASRTAATRVPAFLFPAGLSGFTLNASQCLLNDIFGGRCTTWDCQPILDLNPNFFPPPGVTIQVREFTGHLAPLLSSSVAPSR
jgi:hypothetical protein